MEHIHQFDWCYSEPEPQILLDENDLDNCCTERILRNKFYDPLLSNDSESEAENPEINWDEVFIRKKHQDRWFETYVPGLHPLPPYPKISALSINQHYQLLKVVCARYPNVLESEFVARPTKLDHKLFEDLQEKYLKEQQEYIEWAKSLWLSGHNIRGLRPKPLIETVYDAELKMRLSEVQSLPKNYEMVAQIPLRIENADFELTQPKDLIKVNVSELPLIQFPDLYMKKVTIMRPCVLPEPCSKHLCRFILPTEKSTSVLPLTEVQRELAQYAADNRAQFIASENALKKLVELDQPWNLPVAVCTVLGPDGEKSNVVVLGSDFAINKESSRGRTYRAFRHLLQYSLIPPEEKARILNSWQKLNKDEPAKTNASPRKQNTPATNNGEIERNDLSDDEDNLVIDMDNDGKSDIAESENQFAENEEQEERDKMSEMVNTADHTANINDADKTMMDEIFECTCKDSMHERPPPRSYRKWEVRSANNCQHLQIIVHCSHKVRGKAGEVILEPIPEYQLDLGASALSRNRLESLALSLHLRRNASLMLVRIDALSGDMVMNETLSLEELSRREGAELVAAAESAVGAALAPLAGLRPGHYLLTHEPQHGGNALLQSSRAGAGGARGARGLRLPAPALRAATDADDTHGLKNPPLLTDVLLPVHKFRKILPCAFSPFPRHVQPPRAPLRAARVPPPALQWRKKNKKKRKQRN